jgi:hypothetical protein
MPAAKANAPGLTANNIIALVPACLNYTATGIKKQADKAFS